MTDRNAVLAANRGGEVLLILGQRLLIVGDRLLLVAQLLRLLALFGRLRLLIAHLVELLVELVDAGVGLLDSGFELGDAGLGLTDASSRSGQLALPYLHVLGILQLLLRHQLRRRAGIRYRQFRLLLLDLSQALLRLLESLSCVAQLILGLVPCLHRIRTLIPKLVQRLLGCIISLGLLFIAHRLLPVAECLLAVRQRIGALLQLVRGLLLRLLLLDLSDGQQQIADILGARVGGALGPDPHLMLLAGQRDVANLGAAQRACDRLTDLGLGEAEIRRGLAVDLHFQQLTLLGQVAGDIGQAGDLAEGGLHLLSSLAQILGVLALDRHGDVVVRRPVLSLSDGDLACPLAELGKPRLQVRLHLVRRRTLDQLHGDFRGARTRTHR